MVVVGLKSEYSRSLISYLWWGLGLGYPLGIGCGTPLVRGLVGGLEGGGFKKNLVGLSKNLVSGGFNKIIPCKINRMSMTS